MGEYLRTSMAVMTGSIVCCRDILGDENFLITGVKTYVIK